MASGREGWGTDPKRSPTGLGGTGHRLLPGAVLFARRHKGSRSAAADKAPPVYRRGPPGTRWHCQLQCPEGEEGGSTNLRLLALVQHCHQSTSALTRPSADCKADAADARVTAGLLLITYTEGNKLTTRTSYFRVTLTNIYIMGVNAPSTAPPLPATKAFPEPAWHRVGKGGARTLSAAQRPSRPALWARAHCLHPPR